MLVVVLLCARHCLNVAHVDSGDRTVLRASSSRTPARLSIAETVIAERPRRSSWRDAYNQADLAGRVCEITGLGNSKSPGATTPYIFSFTILTRFTHNRTAYHNVCVLKLKVTKTAQRIRPIPRSGGRRP